MARYAMASMVFATRVFAPWALRGREPYADARDGIATEFRARVASAGIRGRTAIVAFRERTAVKENSR